MDVQNVPIRTFDPLLRDLVYWGLLVRVDCPGGQRWQLAERAECRLDEIAEESRAVALERMIYLDHRCDVCGFRRMTRVHDSRYVCEECRDNLAQSLQHEAEVLQEKMVEQQAERPSEQRRGTPWWQRTA